MCLALIRQATENINSATTHSDPRLVLLSQAAVSFSTIFMTRHEQSKLCKYVKMTNSDELFFSEKRHKQNVVKLFF